MRGKIRSISISKERGEKKYNVSSALLVANHGITGDVHAGPGDRQISILDDKTFVAAQKKGLNIAHGDFGENLTIEGLDLDSIRIGDRIVFNEAIIEVTMKGKECHEPCNIYNTLGECSMSDRGVFARVLKGGSIKKNDEVKILSYD